MENASFDIIIVGGGISGSFVAKYLTQAGLRCLMLEAGQHYKKGEYPSREVDANSQLYWGGGMELNTSADLVFLRPKVLGGGSVVNQALVDRFDDDAWDSWKHASGVSYFESSQMAQWYDKAETEISIQYIDEKFRNGNAKIFAEGFDINGFKYAPLRRAQTDCKTEQGNDCIDCLAGCKLESKQSMPWTLLKRANATGNLTILSEFEVERVSESDTAVQIEGTRRGGITQKFTAKKLVLAGGAIGNSKLLLHSGFQDRLPALGRGFYTHPQFMNLGIYAHRVNAFKGAFQALKSDDPGFRKGGFKLENVFGPPGGISMLVSRLGLPHQEVMEKLPYMGCIEVAVRDTNPGQIRVNKAGVVTIRKTLNEEDEKRRARGFDAIEKIFKSTHAQRVIEGQFGIGLHLMGGCNMGTDPANSVVGPDFKLHGFKRTFAADSSIFPNAPGINPSLTIMALACKAAEEIRA